MSLIKWKNIFIYTFIIIHIIASIITRIFDNSTTSLVYFCIFSASFAALLIATFLCRDFGVKFFGIFIYLGFFFKISVHTILKYGFIEPIGSFSGSYLEWNDFYLISSIGAIAVAIAAVIINKFTPAHFMEYKEDLYCFNLFKKFNKLIFIALALSAVGLGFFNLKFGVTISGLAAITIFHWPINALIGFFLYIGLALLIAVFCYNEIKLFNSIALSTTLVFIEAFMSSISILSRGIFLFHFLPFVICISILRKKIHISKKFISFIFIIGIFSYLISGFLVTTARNSLYAGYALNPIEYQSKNIFSLNESDNSEKSFFNKNNKFMQGVRSYLSQISSLVVDRWIGAEGLMAVISYPNKNFSLIYHTLIRVPQVGQKDIFEEMNKSFYPISTKYVFTSLPGPMAFFYYSGSIVFVFFGMFFFVLLLHSIQLVFSVLTQNIFILFQTAFYLSISCMQFGISPRPLYISLFMIFCLLICIKIGTDFGKKIKL